MKRLTGEVPFSSILRLTTCNFLVSLKIIFLWVICYMFVKLNGAIMKKIKNMRSVVFGLILGFLSWPTTSHSMQNIASFAGSCYESLCATAAIAPFWAQAYSRWKDTRPKEHECYVVEYDVPENVATFVREVLMEREVSNSDSFEVKCQCCGDGQVDAEYFNNTIYVSNTFSKAQIGGDSVEFEISEDGVITYNTSCSEDLSTDQEECAEQILPEDKFWDFITRNTGFVLNLTDALRIKERIMREIESTDSPNSYQVAENDRLQDLKGTLEKIEENLKEHKACLQHEIGHHYHNINNWLLAANAVVPIATYVGSSACAHMLKSKIEPQSLLAKLLTTSLVDGGAALLSYCASTCATAWYVRHHEKLADEFVENDLELLQAHKRLLLRSEECEREYMACGCDEDLCCDPCGSSKKSYYSRLEHRLLGNKFVQSMLDDHPCAKSRIKRLDQRLARLELDMARDIVDR